LSDGLYGRATRGSAGARDGIGINDLAAELLQHVSHGAFAAADAAGEANAHRALRGLVYGLWRRCGLWHVRYGSWGMRGILGHKTSSMAAPAKKGPKGM
jgi:hypothetical protein